MVADRVISVLSFALAVAYLLATRQIPALEIGDPLGPRAIPQLLGAGLNLAAILLFVETLKKAPRAEGQVRHAAEGGADLRLASDGGMTDTGTG